MKSTPHIAVGIIVLILVIAGVSFFFLSAQKVTAPAVSTASSTSTIVKYLCSAGTINATYTTPTETTTQGSVSLTLSDGRNFTLPQTRSGSGIRYEEMAAPGQDIVFSSEGSNAFLSENGKTTFDNCVANSATGNSTVSPAPGGMRTFSDQGKTFSFLYPTELQVAGGGVGYSTDWMVNATTSGMLLAKATLPQSFEPKTNFGDATLTVGTSADPAATSECKTFASSGNGVKKSSVTINGVSYAKFVTNDAGAGNLYNTTSYRTVRNNQCYAIEYTIHSTQLANYPADQGIKAFDELKVQNILEQMVQSFRFL